MFSLAIVVLVLVGTAVGSANLRGEKETFGEESQNRTRHLEAALSGQEAWIESFCSSKCQAAGYCCNDYSIGSNQMISCTQACMMRSRGSSLDDMLTARGGFCKRNGGSGCSLSVNGHDYSFCSRCKDLTPSPKCAFGVASSDACDYGAMLAPTPEEYCSSACKAAGFCCNDFAVGSNQMISCSQACMMRVRGSSLADMLTASDGVCKRTGASGCSLSVNGHDYSFCSHCGDLTDSPKCSFGVASSDACDYGASLPPSSFGAKA